MKLIPYGITDFDRIIYENYYFIDKTRYIQYLEDQGSFILLLRPRRMGKSLFSNMLMSYYDLAKKDRFESLFSDLWIGSHPTPSANRYIVLGLDFSHVNYHPQNLDVNFKEYCQSRIASLFTHYPDIYTVSESTDILSRPSAKDAITRLVDITHSKGLPIYLFIDEYDNFTNTVLVAKGEGAHSEITHGEGFYRDFFKACKGTFERIYMTGVTPVTYDDLTSGFSIAQIISLDAQFNQIIGVSEDELKDMIEYYRSEGCISRDTSVIISEMKPWYDNFCFSEDSYGTESTIYNTNMVIQYMNRIIKVDKTPQDMNDYAARTDSDKLDYLIKADRENINDRISTIKEIAAQGYISGYVKPQFPAAKVGDKENFKSMLFYFGTLTFGGWDDYGVPRLIVPNKTMGNLYLKYMIDYINATTPQLSEHSEQLRDAIRLAAVDGEWGNLVHVIGSLYHEYSSVRNAVRCEADVQGFIRGLLCLNPFFDIWPELELGHGYSDVLLLPNSAPRCATRYSYVIEIKYMKSDQTDIDRYIREACNQLDRYVADTHLHTSTLLRDTTLTPIYMVFQGQELKASGIYQPTD